MKNLKKMKRIYSLLICTFLILGIVICAGGSRVQAARQYDHIYDGANLLTASEKSELEALAVSASEEANADISIVTVLDMGGKSAMDFADDWYDAYGYGVGDDRAGIMLLLCMSTRDYWMTTCGAAYEKFSSSDLDRIGSDMVEYLSYGDYAGGFEVFIKDARNELVPRTYGPLSALGCLLGGFVTAGLPVRAMKGKNKSVKRQYGAANYVKKGSMNVSRRADHFMYNTHTTVRIESEHHEGGGGGGGGHVSSSGTFHGGGGGKF
ncbi:MAG: TPM domain-containing protein [Lachnospiraceae bacterium]|nr:TPM domain-containing protein [Lachnospiraceae bacterium]